MSVSQSKMNQSVRDDADVLAVRALIAEDQAETVHNVFADCVEVTEPSGQTGVRRFRSVQDSKAAQLPPLSGSEPAKAKDARSGVRSIFDSVYQAVKSYRPERKLILRTSLILMLILQPFWIFGSMLFTLFVTVLCYVWAGPERFWKKVISIYGSFAKYKPEAARRLKVKAYVMSRRWDAMVDKLPDLVGDVLRCPDLRAFARADEQHLRALNDRLNRLV